jgi:sucrose phosphorylase
MKKAFHPNSDQKILMLSPKIFSVLRTFSENELILSLINITDEVCKIEISISELKSNKKHWYDIVSGMEWFADDGKIYLTLHPYDIVWLEPFRENTIS